MFQPEKIDFTKTKTFSARDRHNLVRIDNMAVPGQEKGPLFTSPEFDVLVEKLKKARDEKRTITCFIGAHVIKCGLSRYLIWLMENGYITHLASNGAGSIHDFELAYLGGTSEQVMELAKRALLRPVGQPHTDAFYADMERRLLEKINRLGIGPAGLGGTVTALAVNIETYPTHIAGLPVAVNVGCHVTRHASAVL